MKISSLKFVLAIGSCVGVTMGSVTPMLRAQVTSQGKSGWVNPYKELDRTALLIKNNNDNQSIRGVADAVFSFPRALPRAPEMFENVLKDRLVQAEISYRNGAQPGVSEQDITKLVNSFADKLGVPSYAKTSSRQVRVLRMQLAFSSPTFMAAGFMHENMKVGESISERMSPLQAAHLISSLIDQKLINPEFQVEPEEWERVHLASAMEKVQQMKQLRASGQNEDGPKKANIHVLRRRRDLHESLLQASSSLSFLETMDLIDQAFTTLKIGR
jgi:hypothetical protein